jgi:hypothetical protein
MEYDPSQQQNEARLKEIIAAIIADGRVIISSHAKQRMIERGYSLQDVFYILEEGALAASLYDESRRNWRYTFEGEDLDGDSGTVVAVIEESLKCIIITVLA